MKLSQINNLLVDYKTTLAVRQDSKTAILNDAADKNLIVDLSSIDNNSQNDLEKVTNLRDFLNDVIVVL